MLNIKRGENDSLSHEYKEEIFHKSLDLLTSLLSKESIDLCQELLVSRRVGYLEALKLPKFLTILCGHRPHTLVQNSL